MDIFNDDAFTLHSLTAAISETQYVPGRLGALGLFDNEGINTTQLSIEKDGATLALVPAADRGAPGVQVNADRRTLIPFNTLHLPENSTIMADEIQSLRAFGSESEVEAVANYVAKRQAKHRRQLDATHEHLKIGAVKGILMDSDGTTPLLNTFTSFGISQTTHSLVLATATTKVRGKVLEVLDKIEDQLGGVSFTGARGIMGRNLFKKFVDHDSVKDAYARWQDGAALRDDVRSGFEFGGVIWEQYRGQVGSVKFVGDDEGYVIPEGVPDLFIGRFAPANYMETVGTNGLPYYTKIEPMRMNKGVELESQSNPLFLCTRPNAVVKLTG